MLKNQFLNLYINKKLIFFITFILITLWFYPIWYTYDLAVIGDGNIFFQRIEAIRKTVLEYGQWPGNNPWNAGGQPLEGKNGRFIISIKVILSIIFGTKLGLSLFFILFNIIGYYGSYKLCKKFVKANKLGHIFAILVISNSAVMFHLSAGHFAFFTYYLLNNFYIL